MLEMGAQEGISSGSASFYSLLFLVEKVTSWRAVVHILVLNRFVQKTRFKMEAVIS